MQIMIDINENARVELTRSFGVNDVKTAVETLISRYIDRHSEEKKIAKGIKRAMDEVQSGDVLSIEEFKASIR